MPHYSEQEIIKGCQDGQRACQEWLYRQYYSLFLKICARYARNMEDAEQLLNDGFLRIFQNIGSFKNTGSFEGWMKRVLVNTCLDYLKSKQLKDSLHINYNAVIAEESSVSAQAEAIRNMQFKELITLIQQLPAVSKTVFNLYVFEGFSHKEIAAMLNISEGTSSWHLHHARGLLQKRIMKSNAETPVYEQKRV